MQYKEKTNEVPNKTGHILASKFYHKCFPDGYDACSNKYIEHVDNKNWEIFTLYSETEDAYYGMPLEGLGLLDCMLSKSDTRLFTDSELEAWNCVQMGMFGSHTDKLSYTFEAAIRQGYSVWDRR